jgi:hypothetical protein
VNSSGLASPVCLVVAVFGGNANNGTNCGFWYWNMNNDSSNLNSNIGTHLKFCIDENTKLASPLGEIYDCR